MAGADADRGERADIRLGMRRAAHVVAPGMHEGHAGIDRLRGGEPGALKDVAWGHLRPEPRHGREIAVLRPVAGEAAEQRVPHVPVGIDEARHHDHAGAVDPQPASRHIAADRDDRAVAHMHRAAGDVAEPGVHRHHIGIGDGELAARRQLRRGAASRLGQRRQRHRDHSRDRSRAERGDPAHEPAPADFVHDVPRKGIAVCSS